MNFDHEAARRVRNQLMRESYRKDLAHALIRQRVEFCIALGESKFLAHGITPALTERLDHIRALWRTA